MLQRILLKHYGRQTAASVKDIGCILSNNNNNFANYKICFLLWLENSLWTETTDTQQLWWSILLTQSFFKNGQNPTSFFIFVLSSLNTMTNRYSKNDFKSVDCVLGIRTRDRRYVGADDSTELWRLLASKTFLPRASYLVSELTFGFDDPNLNPAEVYRFLFF